MAQSSDVSITRSTIRNLMFRCFLTVLRYEGISLTKCHYTVNDMTGWWSHLAHIRWFTNFARFLILIFVVLLTHLCFYYACGRYSLKRKILVKLTIKIKMYILVIMGKKKLSWNLGSSLLREFCLNSQLSVHFKDLSWVHHWQKIINLKSPFFSAIILNSVHCWQTRFRWVESSLYQPIRKHKMFPMTNENLLLFQLSVVQNAVNISEAEARVIIFTRS